MSFDRIAFALVVLAATAGASGARADGGEMVFKRQCAVCHSSKAGEIKAGPSLFKVVGRKAGTTPAYPYSSAMKASGVTWNATTLDAFIAAPRKAVPKTNMAYPGMADATQRADLVAYLAKLK